MTIDQQKSQLRMKFKEIRNLMSNSEKEIAEKIIFEKFLHHLENFKYKKIGLYVPFGSEINLLPLIETLWQSGFECSVPEMKLGNEMDFHIWKFGEIGEKTTPELLVIPALSCDEFGSRLGYGKGCYDLFLKKNPDIRRISLLFQKQISATKLPTNEHDQKIDLIFTEANIYFTK